MPRITQNWRDERRDEHFLREVGAMGLLGPTLSGYGCAGVSSVAAGLISRELERVDSGYRSMWSVTGSLVMHPIYTFGSEAMKDRLLPRLASGELVGCFGLSEPNAGSDPSAMTSNAVRKGDHWVLNGEKMWISNAPFADVFVVWVKDKADGKVKGFVLERGMPGLSTPKIEGKVSCCLPLFRLLPTPA